MVNSSILALSGLVIVAFAICMVIIPVSFISTSYDVDLYYTQAPFGVLYADISGHFTWGSGSISTSPAEAYSIKYWQDSQLQSLTLDAVDTPIKVDGTFKLSITTVGAYDIYGLHIGDKDDTYVLHLPYLPNNVTQGMFSP